MPNMIKKAGRLAAVGITALAALFAVGLAGGVSEAEADHSSVSAYRAHLAQLNNSGAGGVATVVVVDRSVTVNIQAWGLSPLLPHAQHFHIGGMNVCPPMSADRDGDGLVNTVEGQPFYGPVRVSLTTSGDVSAASALAVARFPVADASGNLSYSRTFDLPSGVSPHDIANAVVVLHGIDLNRNGMYDGAARSSLDPSLPLEATIPAACGKLISDGVDFDVDVDVDVDTDVDVDVDNTNTNTNVNTVNPVIDANVNATNVLPTRPGVGGGQQQQQQQAAVVAPAVVAPAVVAPAVSAGVVAPPRTGDAGLVSENADGSSTALLALAAIVAVGGTVLAGTGLYKRSLS